MPAAPPSRTWIWIVAAVVAAFALGGAGIGAYFAFRKPTVTASEDDDRPRRRKRKVDKDEAAASSAFAVGHVEAPKADAHAAAAVPVTPADPTWGDALAPVTIVMFSDFECPFCSRVESTLDVLRNKYGPTNLRIVWKDFPLPFHKNAPAAHRAAELVFELGGAEAFWSFHRNAFADRKSLNDASYNRWAGEAGVDVTTFKRRFDAGDGQTQVDADHALGERLGVRGTPAFFVNGKFLTGAQPEGKFAAAIDEQLVRAHQLIASGTRRSDVYNVLSAQNFEAPTVGTKPPPAKPAIRDTTTVFRVPVTPFDPQLGPADALVTVVEFADFQCPFCARANATLKQVRSHYGDKVRIVWKDNPLPFHKKALPAAKFAREAFLQKGHAGFWQAHALFFEDTRAFSEADFPRFAALIGMDLAALGRNGAQHATFIDGSQQLSSQLGAAGTPSFFINGRSLRGAQPFEKFREIIDQEVTHASRLVAAGTPATSVYRTMIEAGRTTPMP